MYYFLFIQGMRKTYHSFVPDDAHTLLDAIGPLRDEGEVIFSNSFLCRSEGAVSAACHLKIPTETVQQLQFIFKVLIKCLVLKDYNLHKMSSRAGI